jgi:ArsR family transcriptional regulator
VAVTTTETVTIDCPPLLQRAIEVDEADALAGALRVLADPARLRLLSLIQAQPGREACVCHLIAPLGLSQPTVSHHLKVLHTAGLVTREQRGTWAYYRVVPQTLENLRALLG